MPHILAETGNHQKPIPYERNLHIAVGPVYDQRRLPEIGIFRNHKTDQKWESKIR